MSGASGEASSKSLPPLPKDPTNLKLRYFVYCLAISSRYEIGNEKDPSRKVSNMVAEICERITHSDAGYRIPRSYDKRMRDVIVYLVDAKQNEVMSAAFRSAVTDKQNIIRFFSENMNVD